MLPGRKLANLEWKFKGDSEMATCLASEYLSYFIHARFMETVFSMFTNFFLNW